MVILCKFNISFEITEMPVFLLIRYGKGEKNSRDK